MIRPFLLGLALLLLLACGSDTTTTRSDASMDVDGTGIVDLRPVGRYSISASPGSWITCPPNFISFAGSPVGTDLTGLVVNLDREGTDSVRLALEGTTNLAMSLVAASENGNEWSSIRTAEKTVSGCLLTETLTAKITSDGSDPIRLDVTDEWRNNPLAGCPFPIGTCRNTLAGRGWRT